MRIVRFRAAGEPPRFGLLSAADSTSVSELEQDDILEVLRGARTFTGRTIEALPIDRVKALLATKR